jgi:hypothetical protein
MGTLGYKPKDKNITKLKKYINGLGNDNKQHRTRNDIQRKLDRGV